MSLPATTNPGTSPTPEQSAGRGEFPTCVFEVGTPKFPTCIFEVGNSPPAFLGGEHRGITHRDFGGLVLALTVWVLLCLAVEPVACLIVGPA